jgi:hypothetical protein
MAAGMTLICQVAAQYPDQSSFTLNETLLESIAAMDETSSDYEAILNDLEFLQKNPLDLNRMKREDLERLPFLTDFQITSLLEYREEKGRFLSIYELQVVYGFTDEVIRMLLPFVIVSDRQEPYAFSLRDAGRSGNHEVTLRTQRVLEKSKGYMVFDSAAGDMRYPGNPWLMNLRYEYTEKNHLRAGITLEKDPGEDLFRSSNRAGFDFNSAFVMLKDVGHLKSLVVGDYRLAFGQGLTLWNGAAPGKSSLPLSIVKRQDAVKAFASNDENNFFRGLAASASLGKFTFSAFFSSKMRDANITDTINSGRIYFSSFQESGYHRTPSELADEKSVRETVFGGNLLFRNNFLKIGSTLAYNRFDKYMEAGEDLTDIHDFSGNRLVNWGLDYALTLNKIQLFGETALGNNHWATLHGLLVNVSKYASFSMLYRNFRPGYYSFHSAAFSESSGDSNEEGIYLGAVLHPVKGLKLSGYADFYHFPWLKNNQSAPSGGSDYLLETEYTGKKIKMYFRLKYESDPEDVLSDSALIPEIDALQHSGLRYHMGYRLSESLFMQNRIEMTASKPGSSDASRGFLLYHDVEYRLRKLPLVLDFRLAWFHTDDYASRIYAYEQDMTAGFSFSPMYGRGFRSYLMATVDITKRISGAIRFSNTYYTNKSNIGSGYDIINSSMRNDVKLKLAFRL